MLTRYVLVTQRFRFFEREVERPVQVLADVLAGHGRAAHNRQRIERAVGERTERVEAHAELLEQGHDEPGLVLQKRFEQVGRLDALVVAALRQFGGGLDGLLRLDGKLVEVHQTESIGMGRVGRAPGVGC